MTDDPNLPPESEWPIKKGTPVWCVATGLAVHYPVVRRGRIDHYNAAVKGNGVTSQGKPYYKVMTGKSSHELVRAE